MKYYNGFINPHETTLMIHKHLARYKKEYNILMN